eukprot:3860316-Pleurochrysis_carterae.AAC.1
MHRRPARARFLLSRDLPAMRPGRERTKIHDLPLHPRSAARSRAPGLSHVHAPQPCFPRGRNPRAAWMALRVTRRRPS